MDKQCFKCGQTKPINEFYEHPKMADGHLGKCKTCTKDDSQNRENSLRENDPVWLATERARCRGKADQRRSRGIEHCPSREQLNAWRAANPQKARAHRLARLGQKNGLLKKPTDCAGCNQPRPRLEKHHPDYSKPLAVEWLCPKCHGLTKRKDFSLGPQFFHPQLLHLPALVSAVQLGQM
jgi:hypothetical protein